MTTSLLAPTAETATPLLLFRIGRERFALPLDRVVEAVELTLVHGVPTRLPYLLGVTTWRGALLPVYSGAGVLRVTDGTSTITLVLETASRRVGLAVDDVDDVADVAPDEISMPPARGAVDAVWRGVLRQGTHLLAVLDADALVDRCAALPPEEA